MISKELLGGISVSCCVVGYTIYILSILKGQTKPHTLTWCVWSLVMGIVFCAQFVEGAGAGSWVTGVSMLCCVIIASLSFAKGEKNITMTDWMAFSMALAAIPLWYFTKNPLGAVILLTIVDAGAYYPTYRKSWFKPREENFWLFGIDCIKWTVAFFALDHYSATILLYPSFCFVANIGMVFMIIGRRLFLRPARMAKVITVLAVFAVVLLAGAASYAQNGDGAVYMVTDVPVDVRADSAAHARDQAIIEAQRIGFATLLDRLGVKAELAAKLSNDDLATLVQNFEVQSEHTSSVRYIGTYTVQFRPNAVRKFVAGHGVVINDTRSKQVLVLPIYVNGNHPILWEENTRWRAAWDKVSHDDGLVPVALPAGGLDDIAALSTVEAMDGKAENIKALADKYQLDTVAVVVLTGSVDNPSGGLAIDTTTYDANGSSSLDHIALTVGTDKNAVDLALIDGVHRVRHQLEKEWQDTVKEVTVANPGADGGSPSITEALPQTPLLHLMVDVPVATLNEWAEIKNSVAATSGVAHVNVISVGRGSVSVELEISSTIEELQTALAQNHLRLSQDLLTQAWGLRRI